MSLVAIIAEIVNADTDERKLQKIHIPNWVSMAKDLQDAFNYLGPETSDIVEEAVVDLVTAIHHLFTETTDEDGKRQTRIEHDRRQQVKAVASALCDTLSHDSTIVSSWRDLVSACQDPNHVAYSYDRIAFLRDNVIALQEHRRQDPGHWGLITTAVDILFDYPFSVHRAQVHVGDTPISLDIRRQGEPTGLTHDQRMDLAERWIVRRPFTRDVVVWLRIANAYPQPTGCTVHGNIAFYAAQSLAGGIIDHTVAREICTVVPEELLTDEISAQQANNESVDDYYGFEHRPALVYARVALLDIEPHRAAIEARHQLECLLAVLRPPENMWTILKGHLLFDGSSRPTPLELGPKKDREPTTYFQNDHVGRDLLNFQERGIEVTPDVARRLQPVLQLSYALRSVPRTDPEGIVMAAVRTVEHCNTWTTKGRKQWTEFITAYLLDEFTRTSFLKRALHHTFEAIVRNKPDRAPDAPLVPELEVIKDDVSEGMWGTQFNLEFAIRHIATLKAVYAGHPLARPLSELDDILQSGDSIGRAIDAERERVRARVARLTRSRNAAIHGGPLSEAACDSIADFASDLADQVLNSVTRAIVNGDSIGEYMKANREDNERKIRDLRRTGDRRHFLPNNRGT